MAEERKTGKTDNPDVVRRGERTRAEQVSGMPEGDIDDDLSLSPSTEEQLRALRLELARIKESLSHVAEGTGQLAMTQANTIRDELEEAVVRRPFTALASAALVGYLLGSRLR
ncbi:MAG: hypothetical protein QHC90_26610 [Shinella sp.]|nr:hypothetical protein [Shinella sp.]